MKDIIKAFDELPWILKIIFCLPALDIIWAIYRIIKGVATDDLVKIIVGIIWIPAGGAILWLVDLITMVAYKKLILA